jgi:hypothetical protein
MRNYRMLLLLACVACNSATSDKKSADSGINAPTPSEKIATEKNEAREEAVTKTVTAGAHKFTVLSKGDGTFRSLMVAAINLKGDTTKADSTVIHDVKGFLKDVAVADLDKDGNPELYCFTQAKGTDMAGSVYALSFMNGKGTDIKTDSLEKMDLKGYQGQDSFYIQAPYLVRTYPLYKNGEQNPSGKQTTKYTLKKGVLIEKGTP